MARQFLIIWLMVTLGFSINGFAALPAKTLDGQPFPSLAPMLKQVNPAVVNIATYSTQRQQFNPLMNDPFFRHFFNLPNPRYQKQPQKKQQSAGSGVIVDADKGIVVTNHHVIKSADEIQVSLIDGRTFKAKLLGSDADLDVAVLEIESNELTQVPMGRADRLEVGDYVVAIGNPFGLGQTVTTGIVSALGRSGLGIEGYENFIQTDASINPGNSGGALVNLAGELIGINTAIIAPAGGNVGIGFAIPVDMVKASMEQIIEHGEVKRGQIGVGIQDINSDLRKAFDLQAGQQGVLVTNVDQNSPAAKAGIQSGDIILKVNGHDTATSAQLRSQIGMYPIGTQLTLTVLRKGDILNVSVLVDDPINFVSTKSGEMHPLLQGAYFEETSNGQGVLVSNIRNRSAAARSGLRPGDVVLAANQMSVTDLKSFAKALKKDKHSVLLQVNRRGHSFFLVIR